MTLLPYLFGFGAASAAAYAVAQATAEKVDPTDKEIQRVLHEIKLKSVSIQDKAVELMDRAGVTSGLGADSIDEIRGFRDLTPEQWRAYGLAASLLPAAGVWPYTYGSQITRWIDGKEGVDCSNFVILASNELWRVASLNPAKAALLSPGLMKDFRRVMAHGREPNSLSMMCDPVIEGYQKPGDFALYEGHVTIVLTPADPTTGDSQVLGSAGHEGMVRGMPPRWGVKVYSKTEYTGGPSFICYGRLKPQFRTLLPAPPEGAVVSGLGVGAPETSKIGVLGWGIWEHDIFALDGGMQFKMPLGIKGRAKASMNLDGSVTAYTADGRPQITRRPLPAPPVFDPTFQLPQPHTFPRVGQLTGSPSAADIESLAKVLLGNYGVHTIADEKGQIRVITSEDPGDVPLPRSGMWNGWPVVLQRGPKNVMQAGVGAIPTRGGQALTYEGSRLGLVPIGFWRDADPESELESCWVGAECAQENARKYGGDPGRPTPTPEEAVEQYVQEQLALPTAQSQVDPSWDPRERAAVAAYLDRGKTIAGYRGWSNCRLCGKSNGSQDLGDERYVWPQGYGHYVRDHGVKPPEDFLVWLHSKAPVKARG